MLLHADAVMQVRAREIAEAERAGDHARAAALREAYEREGVLYVRLRDVLVRAVGLAGRR